MEAIKYYVKGAFQGVAETPQVLEQQEELIADLTAKVAALVAEGRSEEEAPGMAKAPVGDDVYNEDPSIIKLEELAAAKLGKEAGLFVPSGTMGNLIALLSHTHPGEEIILGAESHIYYYEVGGLARLAGVLPRLFDDSCGYTDVQSIQKLFRAPNLHLPITRLICLEYTPNRGGGTVGFLEL